MKRLTTNRRHNSVSDQNNFRKVNHNNGRLVGRANKRLGRRLPFVLVLTAVSAIIAAGLTFSNWRPGFEGSRVVDQHRQAGVKVAEPKQTAQPKAAALSVGTGGLTGVGNSVGLEKKIYSPSEIGRPAAPAMTVAQQSQKIPQIVEMTIGEDTEQSSQKSPVLRSDRIPYSSAAANSGERDREQSQDQDAGRVQRGESVATNQTPDGTIDRKPREERLVKAHEFKGDLRNLPRTRPQARERRELEPPALNPRLYVPPGGVSPQSQTPEQGPSITPQASAPAPTPSNVFEGLDRLNWGAGSPPDTNGDVGPTHFIQTVNTSIGIFRKSDGFQEAAFTFNTFMSQGNFGNLCDTNNFGDPVVVYDTFNDRWIITDFAFLTDISNNVLAPAYQCFAASQTGDPLAGGWNFYSRQISDNLNDYPKFGIWPDGLYMSANMFSFGAGSTFRNARVWAFNKAQMYAGRPIVNVVSFDVGGGDFTVIPSNARLQTGTPPPGRPNLFLSTELFLNALTVYKFHVDWNDIGSSTFTGPDTPLAATSWPNAAVANAPQPGTANLIDVLQIRAMVQNQYTNFGGTESLWVPHTVRRVNTSGFAAPRWYQVDVTGGTVAANLPQATTWDPDGANTNHRFMPSLALDRAGNLNLGYSISNSTTLFPSMRYAGRLAADPVNTFSQTEQTFFTGTASQTTSTRWGDYSSMTLDPDGCTFWITNEYANPASQAANQRWLTKFGSIGAFPGCTPVGAGGTVSGTVTVNPGGAPISGATLNLGARSTTTDGSGNYSFTSIPAGTYPSMEASYPGFASASASSIVVTDGNTTTQNFSLTDAADSACLTDTTQSNFLAGSATSTLDLTTSPGDVTLANPIFIDQLNTAGTLTGTGFGTPAWTGQTFISAVTGLIVKADVQLFCSGCGATPPNLTLSVRATSGGLPTGADLATVTIPGSTFASGAITTFTATFGSPATLTSGTQYALVLRPVSAPAGSGYFWVRSSPSTYASGQRVLSADSGATWSADSTRDYNFRTYMQTGYAASGNLISSTKDANPGAGITPIWSTFSWNGTTPANTSLQFQVAGSNNLNGPFNFVGPDGTAGTFFTTSPVNLQPQFYNFRYLEYKAFLATTDSAVTPALNDATFCFNDVDCSSTVATITPTPATVCENSTGNTASGPAGMTSYAWGITNGTITSATNTQSITYTAGASGTVTLNLTVTAPNGCIVSGSTPVTINPYPATPTATNGGPYCEGQTIQLNTPTVAGATYSWTGPNGFTSSLQNPTRTNPTTADGGTYSVTVTVGGCTSAAGSTNVVVNATPATPTASNTGPYIEGVTIQLNTPTVAGATYSWTGPTGFTSSLQNPTRTNSTAADGGTYSVTVTVGGCTSAAGNTNVVVNSCPTSFTVNSNGEASDANPGDGVCATAGSVCTLRAAIEEANALTTCGTININFSGVASPINLSTALPSINHNVNVNGPGANQLTVQRSTAGGTPQFSIFTINGGKTVSISALTMSNGNASIGGGIYNQGTLTLTGCTISGNSVTGINSIGGGIANGTTTGTAALTIANSTISGNAASGGTNSGGGIVNSTGSGTATVTITNSTMSGNSVNSSGSFGGGIYNSALGGTATVTITNSTMSGNSVNGTGGGIYTTGSGTVTVKLSNTIVAGNTKSNGTTADDIGGTVDPTSSFNLIGTGGAGGLTNGVNNNQVGVANALLAPLANYGGPTQTLALLPGSPAINAGSNTIANNAGLTTDQRGAGFNRIANTTVDIGAFESRGFTISAASGTPQSTVWGNAFGSPLIATVSSAFSEPVVGGQVTYIAPGSGPSATFTGGVTTLVVTINASNQAVVNATANNNVGGPYNVVASLAGGSPSANFALTNSKAATTTALGSSPNPSNLAQNVTFTATVTGPVGAGTPTGTVVFKDGGAAISCTNAGGQTLNGSGVATCQTAALTAGPHTITGDYSGDANFNISSGTLSGGQTVNNRPLISLSASTYAVNEADGFVHVVINRTGDTSVAVNVDYATDDTGASSNCGTLNSNLASSKCDYTTFLGTAQFAAGQTSVTLDIPINQDSYTEGPESFTINLSNPTGTAALVLPTSATITISDSAPPAGTTNAIDDNTVFVRQQYHDFLNREPDPAGLTFWVNGLNACSDPAQRPAGQTQAQCIEVRRILTSSAFFLSIEFMQSGTFVRNSYVAALDRPATNNMPGFTEWLRDTQAVQRGVIVGQGSWQATLDANRTAFLNDFVTRAEFVGLYPTTDTPTQYVDKLYLHAAVTPGSAQERTDAIAEFGSASTASDAGARGRALARILQNAAFRAREINRAFVQVEYFGYLRRNPNDPPDNNFNGYNFWVTKLNAFNGDFFAAEMVKAFLASDEYRKRFGQ